MLARHSYLDAVQAAMSRDAACTLVNMQGHLQSILHVHMFSHWVRSIPEALLQFNSVFC